MTYESDPPVPGHPLPQTLHHSEEAQKPAFAGKNMEPQGELQDLERALF